MNIVKTRDGEVLELLRTDKQGSSVYATPNNPNSKTKRLNKEGVGYEKEAIKNLQSELGIKLRVQRSIQVEGAFGVLKEVFDLKRFRRTSTKNVKLELILCAIGYNLAKYHKKRYRKVN